MYRPGWKSSSKALLARVIGRRPATTRGAFEPSPAQLRWDKQCERAMIRDQRGRFRLDADTERDPVLSFKASTMGASNDALLRINPSATCEDCGYPALAHALGDEKVICPRGRAATFERDDETGLIVDNKGRQYVRGDDWVRDSYRPDAKATPDPSVNIVKRAVTIQEWAMATEKQRQFIYSPDYERLKEIRAAVEGNLSVMPTLKAEFSSRVPGVGMTKADTAPPVLARPKRNYGDDY